MGIQKMGPFWRWVSFSKINSHNFLFIPFAMESTFHKFSSFTSLFLSPVQEKSYKILFLVVSWLYTKSIYLNKCKKTHVMRWDCRGPWEGGGVFCTGRGQWEDYTRRLLMRLQIIPTVQYPGPYVTAFECGLYLAICFLQIEYGRSDGISLLRLGYKQTLLPSF